MVKKDRIAIVITVIYSLFPLLLLLDGTMEEFVIFLLPIFLYWGYRFIKGDISFLKQKDS